MKNKVFLIAFFAVICLAVLIAADENQTNDNSTISNVTNITGDNSTNITLIQNETNSTFNNETGDNDHKNLNWTNRCQAVNHRVEGRINQYLNDRDPHLRSFTNLVNILDRIVNESDSRGYNISALQSDLSVLNDKITKFRSDYDLFIQKLENTRNLTCGHSEGQYQEALNESKAQLKIVRADAEDIKDYFNSVIKGDFQNLRHQRQDLAEQRRNLRQQMRENRTEGGFGNGTGRGFKNGSFGNGSGRGFGNGSFGMRPQNLTIRPYGDDSNVTGGRR